MDIKATTMQSLLEDIDSKVLPVDILTEAAMYTAHGPLIWEANSFVGSPSFYPVYKYEKFYSYSPLALILKKRRIVLDREVVESVVKPGFICVPASKFIDAEITRLGSPHNCGFEISDVSEFAEKIVAAMIQDVNAVELQNLDKVNVVLCGGKDSLNLLLLPWRNEVVALSAEPNYGLVKYFIEQNDLKIKLLKLEDIKDDNLLRREILENCCRADLSNWRWAGGLARISNEMNGDVIFWKGQVGDLYMSKTWMAYMHPVKPAARFFRRIYKKTSSFMPDAIFNATGRYIQPGIVKATWDRAASLQGSHMGFIRSLTNCLTLSAYHGPSVMKIWEQADLARLARIDMRPKIGKLLLARDVIYPVHNPAPAPSAFRVGLADPALFLNQLSQIGVAIEK